MLIEFSVCNFLSFKEMQTLRMRRTDDNGKESGSDCAFIYGPNSSGKSNLIKAMDFSQKIILGKDAQPCQPYRNLMNKTTEDSTTYFEYVIEIKGRRYSYGFEIDLQERNSIMGERRKPNRAALKGCITSEWLYDVTGDEEIALIEYDRDSDSKRYYSDTNENGLVLVKKKEYESIYNWFRHRLIIRASEPDVEYTPVRYDFIDYLNRTLPRLDTGITKVVTEPFRNTEIPENLVKKYKKDFSDDCQLIYVDGKGSRRYWLIFADGVGTNKLYSEIRFIHSSDYRARIDEESIGTRKIIQLLALLSSQKTMDDEGTTAVDEIECSIHPLIIGEFVKTFKSDEYKGSQLIFTTHESRLLPEDYSSVNDVWFMDTIMDGDDKESRLYSMKSFDGTLKKYDTMYLDGCFSALPRFTPIYFQEDNQ